MKKNIILLFTLLIAGYMPAQVTIGILESPEKGAGLQLKDLTGINDDGANAFKGLALPRVTLSDKNELYPMFLQDPSNSSSGPNNEYKSDKEALDKTHTGLIVYNVVEDDDKELCLGLNQWDGEKWVCFMEKMGNAKFDPVNCSDIVANGAYIEDAPTTSSNFLSITLNVTKPGAYAITAMTDNGYSFFFSGVALSLGKMLVNVPCQGTPTDIQTDKLTFSGIDLVAGCEPEVEVVSAVATYSLNCSSITVNGQYIKGTNLDPLNMITLMVTVSNPGSYSITTPLTAGVRFSGSGTFSTVGTFPVTLYGTGAPTVNLDFPIIINANTPSGNNTCSTTISMTLPAMTYAVIGNTGTYSWSSPIRKIALTNGASFGPNGKVKILGLSQLWQTDNLTTATNNLNNNSVKPDIVLYFAEGANPNTTISNVLAEYIKKGGVVIYGSADGTSSQVNILLTGIFGASAATATAQSGGSGDDNVYPINNLLNSAIINGPFGNLIGKYWGEDNGQGGSVILTELPPNSVQIASARSTTNTTRNPDHSIVWYNEVYNFAYFGDSCGSDSNNTSTGGYPSSFDSNGLPQSKNYGPGGTNNQWIYNSALELNAVAWAIKKAAETGINPH